MFGKDFTPEDLILYIMVVVILVFFGLMFVQVQPTAVSSADANPIWDYSRTELPVLNYINAHVAVSEMRYKQAEKATASVTTRKNLGFLVGTILAVLGTMVTIRGVREDPTEVKLEAMERALVKITSGSPGMILALLGCLVMVATIVTKDIVRVEDPEFRLEVAGDTMTQASSTVLNDLENELRNLKREFEIIPENEIPESVKTGIDNLLEELESMATPEIK